MLRAIDHIVILVRDLARASEDYARAGFTVTPGGTHAGGATHNALVCFGDGTYFELIAFLGPERQQGHRWWSRLADGEGPIDYALLSDGLPAEADALRGRGLTLQGPADGGRVRPDGQRIAWRSVMLGRGIGDPALPFVIEDVTARALRVPGGPATQHALPAARVAGLTLVTADLHRAAAAFAALLGDAGSEAASDEGTLRRFSLGEQWLALLQPGQLDSPAGRHLAARGEGPYEIVLGGGPGEGDLLPLELTHGARMRVAR